MYLSPEKSLQDVLEFIFTRFWCEFDSVSRGFGFAVDFTRQADTY